MHSFLSRVNSVTAFGFSSLAAITFLCFASTFFNDYTTSVALGASETMIKNVPDYSVSRDKNDLGFVRLDINANFTPLFNWNVRQLFMYLTAEYETNNNKLNQVVLWDKILRRSQNPLLNIKYAPMKYYFWDDGNGLLGHENVTLYLSWNVIPTAGTLPLWIGEGKHVVVFPKEYQQTKGRM